VTVYEKGAEVIRMLQTLVGRDGFRRAMALYFERHDGQAVTCDDFVACVADANGRDLDQFKRWYSQAGTPRLQARGQFDAQARRYTLTLSQQPPASVPASAAGAPFVIPVLTELLGADGRPLCAERLLVLDSPSQSWIFDDVDAPPVPSLLRGFSAPVVLDDGLTESELLVLLAHDSDPFNRWEAGQRLALAQMLPALGHDGPVRLADSFVEAMRSVLRHPTLDPAFKELVLILPSEGYVAELVTPVDPQRIHTVREQFRGQLAGQLHADWVWAHDEHQVREAYQPTPAQAGRRALANLALAMLCQQAVASGDPVWPGRALQRFKNAGNMTDRLGALSALVVSQSPLADAAFERLHALGRGDALVIDKWFMLQAAAPEPLGDGAGRVFARAKALLQHPDFSIRNPNRARSLIYPLCMNNPAAFHRHDAAGYVFWAERLLELDALNPQVAARLARAMDRWPALAEPYRSAAREAIARVAARADLSDDVREIIDSAMEAA